MKPNRNAKNREVENLDKLIRDLGNPLNFSASINFPWLNYYVSQRRLLKRIAHWLNGSPRAKAFLTTIGARHAYLIVRHGKAGVARSFMDLRATLKRNSIVRFTLTAMGAKQFSVLIHKLFFK